MAEGGADRSPTPPDIIHSAILLTTHGAFKFRFGRDASFPAVVVIRHQYPTLIGPARLGRLGTRRISRLIVIGERPRGGRKPRSRSIQLGCCSIFGGHSAPSLELFRERVVRIKRQIGVERP
jgi:hypothetical protein